MSGRATTTVRNLATGDIAEYTQPPERAVVLAYHQLTLNDCNWWEYPEPEPLLLEGKHTFSCGDWCAAKQERGA